MNLFTYVADMIDTHPNITAAALLGSMVIWWIVYTVHHQRRL